MIENADCKTGQNDNVLASGVFMFHICIKSLLTNKKNEKK